MTGSDCANSPSHYYKLPSLRLIHASYNTCTNPLALRECLYHTNRQLVSSTISSAVSAFPPGYGS